MNNETCCSWELGRNGKRRGVGGDISSTGIDRLSHLPEPIIYHILSFLDTKSAVRTSALSRALRCCWKHVPVLHFHSNSFQRYSSFLSFGDKVLSLRYPAVNLHKVSYFEHELHNEILEELESSLLDKVLEYAFSHDTQHLVVDLSSRHTDDPEDSYCFSDYIGTISNCSLKILELMFVRIDGGFGSSGFGMLTTLVVERGLLMSDEDDGEDFDPFSNFHSLKNLSLIHCLHMDYGFLRGRTSLKISGPQLLSLKLENLVCSKMVIVAPRLKFFSLVQHLDSLEFSELSVPSVDHAVIRVDDKDKTMEDGDKCVARRFIALFQGLHNAKSLTLHQKTIQVLGNVSKVLEQQPSPFTRLKNLNLQSSGIPDKVANYFLKG